MYNFYKMKNIFLFLSFDILSFRLHEYSINKFLDLKLNVLYYMIFFVEDVWLWNLEVLFLPAIINVLVLGVWKKIWFGITKAILK